MNFIQTVVVVLVCSFALAACTKFTDCGSKQGKIVSIKVPGCDTGPCILKKGTNVSFEMDFTANNAIKSATTKIYAFLGPIKVPFSPSDTNACHFMSCPIAKGGKAVFKQNLPVRSSYPSVTVKVQWNLVSDSGIITCFQLDAKIQD